MLWGDSRTSEYCDLESGENVDGGAAVDLLGEVGFWVREADWDCGISERCSLEGEKADVEAVVILLGEVGTCGSIGIVFVGEARRVCFAFLLRYLGRTLSSQYDRHCCGV